MNSKNKKIILCIVFFAIAIFIGVCSTEEKGQIKLYELSEERILKSVTGINNLFAYEFKLDDEKYKSINYWIEYYVDGELADKVSVNKISASLYPTYLDENKEGRIYFVEKESVNNKNEIVEYLVSIMISETIATSTFTFENVRKGEQNVFFLNEQQDIIPNEPMILAIKVVQDREFSDFYPIYQSVLTDKEELKKAIDNEDIYIYYASFITDDE